jgi:hypothetical protein
MFKKLVFMALVFGFAAPVRAMDEQAEDELYEGTIDLQEYVQAVANGTVNAGVNLYGLVRHPVDNFLIPAGMLVNDVRIIEACRDMGLNYDPDVNCAAEFEPAQARMGERWKDLESYVKKFVAAPGPKRVEMLAEIAVTSMVPGTAVRGVTKIAANKYKFGVYTRPNKFNNLHPDDLNPRASMSYEEFRSLSGKTAHKWAITTDGKLHLSHPYHEGLLEIKHPDIVNGKPVIAAGMVDAYSGRLGGKAKRGDFFSGHFRTYGEELKQIVPYVFKKYGFNDFKLKQEPFPVTKIPLTHAIPGESVFKLRPTPLLVILAELGGNKQQASGPIPYDPKNYYTDEEDAEMNSSLNFNGLNLPFKVSPNDVVNEHFGMDDGPSNNNATDYDYSSAPRKALGQASLASSQIVQTKSTEQSSQVAMPATKPADDDECRRQKQDERRQEIACRKAELAELQKQIDEAQIRSSNRVKGVKLPPQTRTNLLQVPNQQNRDRVLGSDPVIDANIDSKAIDSFELCRQQPADRRKEIVQKQIEDEPKDQARLVSEQAKLEENASEMRRQEGIERRQAITHREAELQKEESAKTPAAVPATKSVERNKDIELEIDQAAQLRATERNKLVQLENQFNGTMKIAESHVQNLEQARERARILTGQLHEEIVAAKPVTNPSEAQNASDESELTEEQINALADREKVLTKLAKQLLEQGAYIIPTAASLLKEGEQIRDALQDEAQILVRGLEEIKPLKQSHEEVARHTQDIANALAKIPERKQEAASWINHAQKHQIEAMRLPRKTTYLRQKQKHSEEAAREQEQNIRKAKFYVQIQEAECRQWKLTREFDEQVKVLNSGIKSASKAMQQVQNELTDLVNFVQCGVTTRAQAQILALALARMLAFHQSEKNAWEQVLTSAQVYRDCVTQYAMHSAVRSQALTEILVTDEESKDYQEERQRFLKGEMKLTKFIEGCQKEITKTKYDCEITDKACHAVLAQGEALALIPVAAQARAYAESLPNHGGKWFKNDRVPWDEIAARNEAEKLASNAEKAVSQAIAKAEALTNGLPGYFHSGLEQAREQLALAQAREAARKQAAEEAAQAKALAKAAKRERNRQIGMQSHAVTLAAHAMHREIMNNYNAEQQKNNERTKQFYAGQAQRRAEYKTRVDAQNASTQEKMARDRAKTQERRTAESVKRQEALEAKRIQEKVEYKRRMSYNAEKSKKEQQERIDRQKKATTASAPGERGGGSRSSGANSSGGKRGHGSLAGDGVGKGDVFKGDKDEGSIHLTVDGKGLSSKRCVNNPDYYTTRSDGMCDASTPGTSGGSGSSGGSSGGGGE